MLHKINRPGRRRGGPAIAALVAALVSGACAPAPRPTASAPPELWFYQGVNLAEPDVVARLAPVWTRAARAGYRRVVLADTKFGRLEAMNADYFARASRLKLLADSLGLGVIPGVFQVGRSGAMLSGNPNLVEALPVDGTLLEVRDGVARVMSDPSAPDPAGALRGRPARCDRGVRLAGRTASIRDGSARARWSYDVPVLPHRCYHLVWWLRTRGFEGRPRVWVYGGGRRLHFMKTAAPPATQDWNRHELVFDSFEHRLVRITFGLGEAARGDIEWRDWSLEEAGPVNLVRRPDAPFELREAAGGRLLTEGHDFAPVIDSLLGRDPWPGQFSEWHTPPEIRVDRPDGTRLRAAWHHAAIVNGSQVTCCLSEPGTFARLEGEARRMRALWGPGRYLMMFDEIRALGGDSACVRTGLSPGEILARAARRCAAYLPGDTLYVWGDMFDPAQNAVRDYDLVRGDLRGAWEGLEPRVGIVNWNAPRARESLRFFARRGHRQVIAGYYDGAPREIEIWLRAARGVSGVEAILYTTWRGRYDDLEAFARACRAAR